VCGRVEKAGESRFVLVAATDESWVHDDDNWSEEWGIRMYRHLDHHLRQFGVWAPMRARYTDSP
jgi:hypothetical protein